MAAYRPSLADQRWRRFESSCRPERVCIHASGAADIESVEEEQAEVPEAPGQQSRMNAPPRYRDEEAPTPAHIARFGGGVHLHMESWTWVAPPTTIPAARRAPSSCTDFDCHDVHMLCDVRRTGLAEQRRCTLNMEPHARSVCQRVCVPASLRRLRRVFECVLRSVYMFRVQFNACKGGQ